MSVRDINPASVAQAIAEGADTVGLLAARFEVLHASHTLRSTIHDAVEAGLIRRVNDPVWLAPRYEAAQ